MNIHCINRKIGKVECDIAALSPKMLLSLIILFFFKQNTNCHSLSTHEIHNMMYLMYIYIYIYYLYNTVYDICIKLYIGHICDNHKLLYVYWIFHVACIQTCEDICWYSINICVCCLFGTHICTTGESRWRCGIPGAIDSRMDHSLRVPVCRSWIWADVAKEDLLALGPWQHDNWLVVWNINFIFPVILGC